MTGIGPFVYPELPKVTVAAATPPKGSSVAEASAVLGFLTMNVPAVAVAVTTSGTPFWSL